MVLSVTVATLRVRGVHRCEVGSDQLLVPDEGAGLHFRGDRPDPVDLGRRERDAVLELEEDEPRKAEVVLGHFEGRVERVDVGPERDDASGQGGLGALLGYVSEKADRDPEHGRLVDRGGEEIGDPVLELLAAVGRDSVDGPLRTSALAARLARLRVAGGVPLLHWTGGGGGLAPRPPRTTCGAL